MILVLADLFRTWWAEQDQSTRRRVLKLQPGDHLSGDLALDLQMRGFSVVATGVVWSAGEREWIGVYEQPAELLAFLADGETPAR